MTPWRGSLQPQPSPQMPVALADTLTATSWERSVAETPKVEDKTLAAEYLTA